MIREQDLRLWIEDKKKELVQTGWNLIRQDAAKNKFSVHAGQARMLEELEADIPDLLKMAKNS